MGDNERVQKMTGIRLLVRNLLLQLNLIENAFIFTFILTYMLFINSFYHEKIYPDANDNQTDTGLRAPDLFPERFRHGCRGGDEIPDAGPDDGYLG